MLFIFKPFSDIRCPIGMHIGPMAMGLIQKPLAFINITIRMD
jgi:hypothetical protein